MRNVPLILSLAELKILKEFYSKDDLLTPYNRNRLLSELKEPKIVDRENLPSNVVSLFSKVLLWNMSKGQTFTVHIVPEISSAEHNIEIPSRDPLSIAMLGYREGSTIDWEMNDGINTFKILSVCKMIRNLVNG